MCNFINLVRLLVNGKVIKQIKVFIELLPTDIKILFNDIIAKAENLDKSDPYMKVLSLKAILQFKQIFENRYNEIRNNNGYVPSCSLSRNEIEQQVSKCYEEYSSVDENSILTDDYKKFKEMERAAQDIQLEQKPEQKSDVFLYTEKSASIPKDHNFKPKYVSSCNSEISYSSVNDIKFDLPNLDIPNSEDIFQITIPKLNDIYLSAIKGALVLPIFVRNMKSQQSEKMEKEAEKFFSCLLQLYEITHDKNLSFISVTTNLFNESFSSMIGKFKKAGVDFGEMLSLKYDENNQDFFRYPYKDEFRIPDDEWNTSK